MKTLELANATNYANIYSIKENGQTIGTIEIVLAGINAGRSRCCVWSGKYTKRDIRKFYKELRK